MTTGVQESGEPDQDPSRASRGKYRPGAAMRKAATHASARRTRPPQKSGSPRSATKPGGTRVEAPPPADERRDDQKRRRVESSDGPKKGAGRRDEQPGHSAGKRIVEARPAFHEQVKFL